MGRGGAERKYDAGYTKGGDETKGGDGMHVKPPTRNAQHL